LLVVGFFLLKTAAGYLAVLLGSQSAAQGIVIGAAILFVYRYVVLPEQRYQCKHDCLL